jgi:transcriptional regulator NrdR family protein
MICPYCRGERVAVERTRSYESVVFRWRRCEACGRMWTTEEVMSDGDKVVKMVVQGENPEKKVHI